jgi:hypothetical protein
MVVSQVIRYKKIGKEAKRFGKRVEKAVKRTLGNQKELFNPCFDKYKKNCSNSFCVDRCREAC